MRVDLTMCREHGVIKGPVHDCLKGSWRIGEAKASQSEAPSTGSGQKGVLEGRLGLVRLLQQYVIEARGSIKACKVLGALQLVRQVINTRSRVAIFNCQVVHSADHA